MCSGLRSGNGIWRGQDSGVSIEFIERWEIRPITFHYGQEPMLPGIEGCFHLQHANTPVLLHVKRRIRIAD